MSNILDHIAPTPVLDIVDNSPRATTRTEWFRLTRDLIQSVIADMDLYPDSLSQVEEAFISEVLLNLSNKRPHQSFLCRFSKNEQVLIIKTAKINTG